ncbi:MAG: hypothetical protein Q9184_000611 [Pyrenodesmia sp. 2 TL-2023]
MSEFTTKSRRRLLLVYIHGFMGNETSFQNFPSHVHRSLSQQLLATYTVDSVVYPRFKTRKKINVAGDDFSGWCDPLSGSQTVIATDTARLQQHESNNSDIVLLGHSMGGLLAADVALLTSKGNSGHGRPSRHRILGVVGLDTPFLGMHPSVIVSGLGSLFKGKPERSDPATLKGKEQDSTASNASLSAQDLSDMSLLPALTPEISATSTPSTSNLDTLSELDPPADTFLTVPSASAEKPTPWSRAWYFINKHSDNVTKASKAYLTSHLEFGGCMADYHGLVDRYDRIRALEDREGGRVRFVNYYTATTGRLKRSKEETIDPKVETWADQQAQSRSSEEADSLEGSLQHLKLSESVSEPPHTPSPRLSISSSSTKDPPPSPQHSKSDSLSTLPSTSQTTLATLPPDPFNDTLHTPTYLSLSSSHPSQEPLSSSSLPTIPTRPATPPPFNPSPTLHPTPSALKAASRLHAAEQKAHRHAIKERDKAILSQRKALAKAARKAWKPPSTEKDSASQDQKQSLEESRKAADDQSPLLSTQENPVTITDGAPEPMPPVPTESSIPSTASSSSSSRQRPPPLPPRQPLPQRQPPPLPAPPHNKSKHRHFCLLPRKDSRGERDRCWVRVTMEDVDEVGAHCGLFAARGGHYVWFVKEVVGRIEGWVMEA